MTITTLPRPLTPTLPRNVALIGFMGSGKTTVGRILARHLGWQFVDTDAHIVAAAGGDRSVAELFAAEGEAQFREREAATLRAVCAGESQIIATGGGAVLRPENARILANAALVVWLTTRPEVVVARTRHNAASRPLLAHALGDANTPEEQEAALLAHVLGLIADRGPHYHRASHLIVDASDRRPAALAAEIARKAERWMQTPQRTSPSTARRGAAR